MQIISRLILTEDLPMIESEKLTRQFMIILKHYKLTLIMLIAFIIGE
jgi:hypothetical protein